MRALDADEARAAVAEHGGDADGDVAVAVCFLFSYLNPDNELAVRDGARRRRVGLALPRDRPDLARVRARHRRDPRRLPQAHRQALRRRRRRGVQGAGRGRALVAAEVQRRPRAVGRVEPAPGARAPVGHRRRRDRRRASTRARPTRRAASCSTWAGRAATSACSSTAPRCSRRSTRSSSACPVAVPTVSTKTIGAGGGSIGWIDPGGFLQVGPQSAGADPGPACYGRGGEEPTLTDANVVLGRLNPDYFLGGNLELDASRSTRPSSALARAARRATPCRSRRRWCASPTRTWPTRSASSPSRRASTRATTRSSRWAAPGRPTPRRSPRRSAMDRVIVPLHPGLTSAFGALAADVRVDEVKSVSAQEHDGRAATEVDALFDDHRRRPRPSHFTPRAAPARSRPSSASIAMRYEGQNYEQEIPVADGAVDAATARRGARALPRRCTTSSTATASTAAGRARPAAGDRDRGRRRGALPALRLDVRGRTAGRRAAEPSAPPTCTSPTAASVHTPVIARTRADRARQSRTGPADRRVDGHDRRRAAGLDGRERRRRHPGPAPQRRVQVLRGDGRSGRAAN